MIIDHQDDLGTYLRQTAPELATSQFVKEANWTEKPSMMERDFAIILVEDNGTEHRKLAMQDAGNTLASIHYFLTTDHELPDGAVKLAAANLLNSAMHYGLYDHYGDSLLFSEKLGSAFDVLASLADSLPSDGIIDERRVSVKVANQNNPAAYAMNTGMTGGGMSNAAHQFNAMSVNPGMMKNPGMNMPMASGSNPTVMHTSKMASTSYELIKEAQWNWPEIDPVDRRTFALIIKEAAAEEGAHVPDFIAQYTGHDLNPDFEMIMKRRQEYVANPELQSDYDRLSKVAHAMDLADATEALYLLDEQSGLLDRYGSNVPDPVLAVYGCSTKEAMWSWNHGGDYCTARELEMLCKDPVKRKRLENTFSHDICCAMMDNPVKCFESLPIEQQVIVSRMANTSDF